MKALILNSGTGQRLRPITDQIPKCLIQINDKTILEHQLDILKSYKINNFIITTGPFEHKIKQAISNAFPELNVKYIHNPKFKSTNYIYSMWLTREMIDDDILLLHGDLIFENKVIEKLMNKHEDSVIIYKTVDNPGKDFKAQIHHGIIKKIGVELKGNNIYYLMPLYFFTQKRISSWFLEIDKFIQEGKLNCYAEDAFNKISDTLQLHPLLLDNEFCMEIDTPADLEYAKNFLTNKRTNF